MESTRDLASQKGFAASFDDAVGRGRAVGGDHPAAVTSASGVEVEPRIRRLQSVELSTDELSDLAGWAVAGDGGARDRLVARCLPMVMRVARGYAGRDVESADLVQEGVLGLLRALERFDPSRVCRSPRMRGGGCARRCSRRSRSSRDRYGYRPMCCGISTSCGRRGARSLGVRDGRLRRGSWSESWGGRRVGLMTCCVRSGRRCRWTRRIRVTRTRFDRLGDLIGDPLSEQAYDDVLDRAAGDSIRRLLSTLTERERRVLQWRLGVESEALSLRQIGRRLGMSAERVRQIEQRWSSSAAPLFPRG
jgi:RNA polymerase primary sigma factor